MAGTHRFKAGLLGGEVEARIDGDTVEIVRRGRVRGRMRLCEVSHAQWVELADEYQGAARRSLDLWAGRRRLQLLQKNGFWNGAVEVADFYVACAAVLRALAAARPQARVYYGSRGGARLLYAALIAPCAVIGVLLIADALLREESLPGRVVLIALGAVFLATPVWWIRRLSLGSRTPQWEAAALAAEMERWLRQRV